MKTLKPLSFNEIKKQIEEESAKLWNNTHCGQEAMWAKSDIKDLENFQQFYTKEQVDGLVAELQKQKKTLKKVGRYNVKNLEWNNAIDMFLVLLREE